MSRRTFRYRVIVAFTLASGLAACGSDSTGPSHANVTGQWTLNATNLTGSGITCNATGVRLSLNQTGTTFTGTYGSGTLECEGLSSGVQGVVVNGTVNLQQVSFDLDTQDLHFTGSVSGNSMSGTVTMRLVVQGITHTFTGNWSASRQ